VPNVACRTQHYTRQTWAEKFTDGAAETLERKKYLQSKFQQSSLNIKICISAFFYGFCKADASLQIANTDINRLYEAQLSYILILSKNQTFSTTED